MRRQSAIGAAAPTNTAMTMITWMTTVFGSRSEMLKSTFHLLPGVSCRWMGRAGRPRPAWTTRGVQPAGHAGRKARTDLVIVTHRVTIPRNAGSRRRVASPVFPDAALTRAGAEKSVRQELDGDGRSGVSPCIVAV